MKMKENIITISQYKGKMNAKLNIPCSFLEKIGVTPSKRAISVSYLKNKILIKSGLGQVVMFYSNAQNAAKISLRYSALETLGIDYNNRKVTIFLDEENKAIIISSRNNFYNNLLNFLFEEIESSNLINEFKKDSWEKTKIYYYELPKENRVANVATLIKKILELKSNT